MKPYIKHLNGNGTSIFVSYSYQSFTHEGDRRENISCSNFLHNSQRGLEIRFPRLFFTAFPFPRLQKIKQYKS